MSTQHLPAAVVIRRSMSEKQLQQEVQQWLSLNGWLWFHDNDSRQNNPGFPDIFAVHEATGFTIAAELKTEKGRLRPEQRRWLDALARGPVHTFVNPVRPTNVDRFFDRLTQLARNGAEMA